MNVDGLTFTRAHVGQRRLGWEARDGDYELRIAPERGTWRIVVLYAACRYPRPAMQQRGFSTALHAARAGRAYVATRHVWADKKGA